MSSSFAIIQAPIPAKRRRRANAPNTVQKKQLRAIAQALSREFTASRGESYRTGLHEIRDARRLHIGDIKKDYLGRLHDAKGHYISARKKYVHDELKTHRRKMGYAIRATPTRRRAAPRVVEVVVESPRSPHRMRPASPSRVLEVVVASPPRQRPLTPRPRPARAAAARAIARFARAR
ncbi:MAG: hypothetical protein WC763_05700 [Candidatus Paceibacterota bacterium]